MQNTSILVRIIHTILNSIVIVRRSNTMDTLLLVFLYNWNNKTKCINFYVKNKIRYRMYLRYYKNVLVLTYATSCITVCKIQLVRTQFCRLLRIVDIIAHSCARNKYIYMHLYSTLLVDRYAFFETIKQFESFFKRIYNTVFACMQVCVLIYLLYCTLLRCNVITSLLRTQLGVLVYLQALNAQKQNVQVAAVVAESTLLTDAQVVHTAIQRYERSLHSALQCSATLALTESYITVVLVLRTSRISQFLNFCMRDGAKYLAYKHLMHALQYLKHQYGIRPVRALQWLEALPVPQYKVLCTKERGSVRYHPRVLFGIRCERALMQFVWTQFMRIRKYCMQVGAEHMPRWLAQIPVALRSKLYIQIAVFCMIELSSIEVIQLRTQLRENMFEHSVLPDEHTQERVKDTQRLVQSQRVHDVARMYARVKIWNKYEWYIYATTRIAYRNRKKLAIVRALTKFPTRSTSVRKWAYAWRQYGGVRKRTYVVRRTQIRTRKRGRANYGSV